ncbi:MAG: hypothetical protein IJZ51_09130 [Ruminiclostridium sp.]|nr:hypothetical protein [Ruminiclostridium sp.]
MDKKDELMNKAKNIADAGLKKADEIYRISKLKLKCVQLDNQIKAKYTELGKTVYGMVKHDSADSEKISAYVMEIEALYTKMRKVYAEIETAKKIITCPVCGTKNKFSDTYCRSCANRLVATDEDPDDYSFVPETEDE